MEKEKLEFMALLARYQNWAMECQTLGGIGELTRDLAGDLGSLRAKIGAPVK